MKEKERVINIRILFVIFCGLMVGILFSHAYVMKQINLLQLSALICIMFFVSIVVWLYAHFTHKNNIKSKYRKQISPILKASAIGFFASVIIGFIVLIVPMINIISSPNINSPVLVSGKVCDFVEEDATYKKFLINNVYIVSESQEYDLDSKICVYTNKQTLVSLGDEIKFTCTLELYDPKYSDGINMQYQGITYRTFVNSGSITIVPGKASIRESIQDKSLDLLKQNLNHDNAQISFAMLFGQKHGLSSDIRDVFSYSGISHILAVSGLHVGVLFSCIYYLMKKIKVNKYFRLSILGLVLFFYSYLCNFAPSVCRASIMSMILALSDVFRFRYDMLSSLSIAGIIILLFSPCSLFTLSFQLSFMCIFSIICLTPTLNKFLLKCKCPKFLASSLSLSVATNIGILPFCVNSFTKVSLLGVITNIIVIPVFSITFILFFAIWIISLIFNFMGFLFVIPNLFLQIIKVVANYVSSLGAGVFKTFNITYWIIVAFLGAGLVIHFLMVKNVFKTVISISLLIVIISIFVSSFIPNHYVGQNLIVHFKYNSNSCYYVEDNEVTLIGANIDSSYILSQMKKSKISKIENIVAYDFQLNDINNLVQICKDNSCKTLYLPRKYEYYDVSKRFDNVKYFDYSLKIKSLMITTYVFNDAIVAINLNTDKMGNIFIPEIKPNKSEARYLHNLLGNNLDIDYIYLNNIDINLDMNILKPKYIISNTSPGADIYLRDLDYKIINFD